MIGREEIICERLKDAHDVLVVSHIRPDADAVGSMLGLGLALQNTGKKVQMVLSEPVPVSFRFLPGSEQIRRRAEGQFDTIIVVDCSELSRVGAALDGYPQPDICIDHHATNLSFAALNFVLSEAVATAAVLAEYLPVWGYQITPPVAQALLSGLIGDTIGFRTSNMTADTLRLAAKLTEAGADLHDVYDRTLVKRSFQAVKYWGQGLSHLQRDEWIAWTCLTLEDRKVVGYTGNDDADLVNVISGIDGAHVVVMFVEQFAGKVKISWRSQNGIDVSKLALHFGGGGHRAASGAEVTGNLAEVMEEVLRETRKVVQQYS
ncbi:MAG TPA: bifunctional oligoribonuclease/PAP phosphatase NrnA [Anaerolineaceae bacterium]|nr:bifunctional oligoribonuclease/PAP phosphatase NrnA [Anaerolineaceae bacterium]HPN54081.1 bifunctional oligoribonuclease/PAP phosphatase NrnA [Anaerolineaceae bacterium]